MSRSNHAGRAFCGIVAWPTSCVFRLEVFGVPTGIALTFGVRGPIVVAGLLPACSRPRTPIFFLTSRLHCTIRNAAKPAYKNQRHTDFVKVSFTSNNNALLESQFSEENKRHFMPNCEAPEVNRVPKKHSVPKGGRSVRLFSVYARKKRGGGRSPRTSPL